MKASEAGIATPPTEAELAEWEALTQGSGEWSGADVVRLIAEVRRLRYRVGPPRLMRTPGVCGGEATLGHTRICVWHVVAVAHHYDWDAARIRAWEFPDLSVEEVQLALDYYRENREEIESIFRREDEARKRLRAAPAAAAT
jgi:uncharacterized protein (DUF433 family)